MLVLDTTDSMNTADTSCDIKGASRLDCAMAGVRTPISTLSPCASSLTSCGSVTKGNVNQPVDEAEIFVFPGLTNTSQVQYEYDCSNTPAPKISELRSFADLFHRSTFERFPHVRFDYRVEHQLNSGTRFARRKYKLQ